MFPFKKTFDFGIPWPDDEELPDRSKMNIIDISDDDDESFFQPEVTDLIDNDNSLVKISEEDNNEFSILVNDFDINSDINHVSKKARFSKITDRKEIIERIKGNVPKKTQYQNSWAVGIWNNWAAWRNLIEDKSLVSVFQWIFKI